MPRNIDQIRWENLTEQQKQFIRNWNLLTERDKEAIYRRVLRLLAKKCEALAKAANNDKTQ